MKVLQIINSLGTGGAEKLLLDTLPLYRKAGIDMDVLVMWNNNHHFVTELEKLNCCNIYILNESKNINDIYKLKNIIKIREYLRKYDIAHVHLFPAQYFAVFANFFNRKSCKLIFTEHNTFNKRMNKIIFKLVERTVYFGYSKIVCISDEVKDRLVNHIDNLKNKIIIIPNGVNITALDNAEKINPESIHKNISAQDKIILHVAAFRPQKDQSTAIKAMQYVDDKNLKLVFVGDGECKADCEELVKSLKLEDRVFFLGQRSDIPSLLKSSFLVLLSSHYEGLSLSSIEGMASGRPFIASNVPGLNQLVKNVGILFEHADEKDLSLKINFLNSNPNYYNHIAKSCRKKAEDFNILNMVQRHFELYYTIHEN